MGERAKGKPRSGAREWRDEEKRRNIAEVALISTLGAEATLGHFLDSSGIAERPRLSAYRSAYGIRLSGGKESFYSIFGEPDSITSIKLELCDSGGLVLLLALVIYSTTRLRKRHPSRPAADEETGGQSGRHAGRADRQTGNE